MKIAFLQIFDKREEAVKAIADISTALPDHTHKLDEAHHQVQVLTNVKGQTNLASYGDLDDKKVFVVSSVAPS